MPTRGEYTRAPPDPYPPNIGRGENSEANHHVAILDLATGSSNLGRLSAFGFVRQLDAAPKTESCLTDGRSANASLSKYRPTT
jgi:hypothetical protein